MIILKRLLKKIFKIIAIIAIAIIVITAGVKEIKMDDTKSLYDELNEEATLKMLNFNIAKVSSRFAERESEVQTDVEANTETNTETTNAFSGIDIEAKLQEKIDILKERNKLDTYIKKEHIEDTLRAFIKAEYITQYPDLRSDDKIGTPTEGNEFQGCIQIYRALSDNTTKRLTYIEKSVFDEYITNNDMKATDHFTLDSDGNLIVTGWEKVTTNVKSNVSGVENVKDKVEYKLITNSINYKSMVEVYTMPFDLLWTFTVMGEDEEFVKELAQLALDSKIIFTVQDNLTVETKTQIEEYEIQEKTIKEATLTVTIDDKRNGKLSEIKHEKKPVPYKTETIIKTEICSTNIDMTYADTWVVKYENEYSNTIPNSDPGITDVQEIEDEDYKKLNVTLLPDDDEEMKEEILKYQIELCGSKEAYLKKVEEGKISGKINTIFLTTYSKTINKKITNTIETITNNTFVKGTPTITEKTDKKAEEDNFVKVFLRSQKAKSNIRSLSEWLFEALEESPKTADMVDLIKYLLYASTKIGYGIEKFDFGTFLPKPNDSGNSERSAIGLTTYLRQFSGVGDAAQTADGKYYWMIGDGVGWPTIGNADLQWKSVANKFSKPGKIIHKGQEKEVTNVAQYVLTNCLWRGLEALYTDAEVKSMQIGIDKKMVDDVGDEMQKITLETVQNEMSGLNLSKQQLYALIAVKYNFGHLPVRNGRTFKQTYLDGLNKYEAGSWEHNKYIWDNWWCALGGGAPGHIPARDAAYETYVKGVFDLYKSNAGGVFARKYYIYYTREQIAKFSYAPNKPITRTKSNEKDIFTMSLATGEFKADSSDPRVKGYYTSSTGRVFTVLNQTKISGWGSCCNRAAAAIIASGYSDQTADQLINTINSDKAKNGWGVIPGNSYFNSYGLKKEKESASYLGVKEYTELIRKQLNKGGYAMVWINNNESTYRGKSGQVWTKKYHWLAIVDYRVQDGQEEIMILDWHGGDWYPIDEFRLGISNYVLISEK